MTRNSVEIRLDLGVFTCTLGFLALREQRINGHIAVRPILEAFFSTSPIINQARAKA